MSRCIALKCAMSRCKTGIQTRNDFALHVHHLLPAVDSEAAIGVMPDHPDRKRIEKEASLSGSLI
ncbi:MAG TPA: hypothetical protein QGF41_12020 [Gammaproteobacteria bacterium]|nr:hypothetical protein [Gammaproteobacteria bacterium]